MTDHLGMAARIARNALRFGWYSGVGWLAAREAGRYAMSPRVEPPRRPVPARAELMADLRRLFLSDAQAVRDRIYPGDEPAGAGGLLRHLSRLRAMFADIPATAGRRATRQAESAMELPEAESRPAYFTQDFHFQTGGYLSDDSAALYDVQVETLFYGSAAAMRRSALRPIAEFLRGKDQRRVSLLDVACGTGRFLREARLAFPALHMTGLDLSKAYLRESERHLRGLRAIELIVANAEEMPLPAESQDIVSSIFLYHELPPEVRARVTTEIARVMKPGGLFVLIDSLQFGDKPGWDGLLEAFPARFHEPYYRSYLVEDLPRLLSAAGLTKQASWTAFLAKVEVWRKKA